MSKRYGRKQKAKARAEIAHLKDRIGRESTEHMYLPGDVPDLTSLTRVVEYSVTELGGRGMMIEREAQVTVEEIKDIYSLVANQTLVQFRGTQYIIRNADYEVRTRFEALGGPSYCRLDLVGVAA